jgi:hypothetical protein
MPHDLSEILTALAVLVVALAALIRAVRRTCA